MPGLVLGGLGVDHELRDLGAGDVAQAVGDDGAWAREFLRDRRNSDGVGQKCTQDESLVKGDMEEKHGRVAEWLKILTHTQMEGDS